MSLRYKIHHMGGHGEDKVLRPAKEGEKHDYEFHGASDHDELVERMDHDDAYIVRYKDGVGHVHVRKHSPYNEDVMDSALAHGHDYVPSNEFEFKK